MKTYNLRNISLALLVVFIIFKFFNTPYNIYSILLSNYEDRMTQEYGDCQNESWGFYNHVIQKFNLGDKAIKILNDEGHVTLENLTNLRITNDNAEYLMILNYKSQNDEDIYNNKYNFIKNYKTIYRLNNCYLMRLND